MSMRFTTIRPGLRGALWAAGLLLGLLQGCAYSDQLVILSYEPVVPSVQAGDTAVIIEPFGDARANQTIVGEVRNLNAQRTADKFVEESVAAWVTDAFAQELARAGLRLKDPGSSAERSVTGTVEKIFISSNPDFQLLCNLRVRVVARRGATTVLDHVYVGKGTSKAVTGAKSEDSEAVREALQSITRVAVPEIVGMIR